ncbi:hypothetical protein [Helicobacter sp. MIT 01-3238]|uniref:hypothetical protein n=1 Tax=Helicobacter sp. MIT 01-3238 TaxID=398627 RepID=UPI000E1F0172|nr:hypothetical protein [Helicobacter sp. MIT 01-3238]RDU52055.1 hypothetical protein CQA40_08495 [Helicobacter sp. MIT 01-3238]
MFQKFKVNGFLSIVGTDFGRVDLCRVLFRFYTKQHGKRQNNYKQNNAINLKDKQKKEIAE